jgi:tetratricopeptide (TPR) repeat protein
MFARTIRPVTFSILLFTSLTARASAQDALQTVKDLYASAAYEDALTAVGEVGPLAPSAETAQYRVLCLVALGRMPEADRVVESLLTAEPEYRPDAAQASPRILALFSQVRHRIGPGLVKRAYQQGRAAMERKDRAEAISQFEAMLRLADDADVLNDATVGELKELGSGFLELSRALPAKPQPVAAPASSVAPGSVSRYGVIVPPRAIEQKLPPWVPNPINRRATEFRGSVRVQISAEGKVVSAEILTPIHPAYDSLLLRAARGWLYEPARKDGVAIAIEKTIDIVVSPAGK